MTEYMYRYDDIHYAPFNLDSDLISNEYYIKIILEEHPIIKYTEKGVWIDNYGTKKFVLLSGRKRFAWPTKEEALESFKRRKEAQIRILKKQLEDAEIALDKANSSPEKCQVIQCDLMMEE